jgi:hypothetical protein
MVGGSAYSSPTLPVRIISNYVQMERIDKWEREHRRRIALYERQIDEIYREAVHEAALIGVSIGVGLPSDEIFSFDRFPMVKKRVSKLMEGLRDNLTAAIVNGIKAEWTLANNKNSELARTVFGDNVGKLTQEQYRRYFSTNGSARDAFINRKVAGLKLSDRVWNYTDQFKTEIELGLDVGIRSGRSAEDMSRDLRRYLRYPDMLFRRVRDEHGNLQLSKAAEAFHPGRGVYRSSYKNARRLAATETNIAYRTADFERWQQLDFVVGIEIHLSNNHPVPDICDDLQGRYPKDFKFTGWHPHCRCHVTTILKTKEEMAADTQRILNGEEPDGKSVNRVEDVPKEFKKWLKDNRERAKRSFSVPYFVKDNMKYVPKGYQSLYGSRMPYDSFAEYEAALRYNKAHAQFSPEIAANIKELNKVLPVMQGKIMNFSEADGSKGNPGYALKNSDELGFRHNCQTCTMAYELRRRGFDVEAMGNPIIKGYKRMREMDRFYENSADWEMRFLNPSGTKAFYRWSNIDNLTDTGEAKRAWIAGRTIEVGRYEVYCAWKGKPGGSHVFIVERTLSGDLIWFDPQSGKKGNDIRLYAERMIANKIGVLRIDNKIINPKYAERMLKARK